MKFLILLIALAGCDQLASKGNLEFERQEPLTAETEVSFKDLTEKIFAPSNCLSCHATFSDEAQIKMRVEAGRPELSSLYILIENGNMPPGGPKVSDENLAYLKKYIEQLASTDTPDETDGGDQGGEDEIRVTLAQINEQIIEKYSCSSCHSAYRDLPSAIDEEVVPGDPSSSLFYTVLESGFMPLRGGPVSAEDLALVEKYILELGRQ